MHVIRSVALLHWKILAILHDAAEPLPAYKISQRLGPGLRPAGGAAEIDQHCEHLAARFPIIGTQPPGENRAIQWRLRTRNDDPISPTIWQQLARIAGTAPQLDDDLPAKKCLDLLADIYATR